MSADVDGTKKFIRAFLWREFQEVRAPSDRSGKVQLEVWAGQLRSRPAGVEFDRADRVNIWVRTAGDIPPHRPTSIERVDKEPKGRGWTDAAGDGANSNLSCYDEFRTRKITRLAVKSEEDARLVLEHLVR